MQLLPVSPRGPAAPSHHLGEQLVLEAALRRDEVDERALRRDLGLVVRVGQLRLQVQLEVRVVLDLLAAELEEERAPFL